MTEEPTLVTPYKIFQKRPHGFQGFICYGERGSGKTSYAVKSMVNYYENVDGMDEEEAYERALENTLFRIEDVIDEVENHIGDPKPILCWDDAGTFASSHRWFSHRKQVQILKGLSDTIRTSVTGLILTTPTPKGLLKFLRDYDNFYVKITKRSGDYRRLAKGYSQKTLPSGKTMVKKRFEDEYSCYLPKWVFEKYNRKRQKYVRELNEKLRERIEEED